MAHIRASCSDMRLCQHHSYTGAIMSSIAPSRIPKKRLHSARAAIRQHQRSDLLAAVLQIAGQIAGMLEIEPLIDQLAQQAKARLGYPEVAVLLVEGDLLVCRACAGAQAVRQGTSVPRDEDSLPAQALRLGAPIYPSTGPAVFPLLVGAQRYGVIELE